MSPVGLLFFIVNAVALMVLPKRWAPIPLLVGCCYMTVGQGINLGPVTLPVIRMLLAVGFLRTLIRGELPAGGVNAIDRMMVLLAGWLFLASFFHSGPGSGPLFITGVIANFGLVYYLIRVFCYDWQQMVSLTKVLAILLVPVALEMIHEKVSGRNLFSAAFGGVSEAVVERNDRLRARGPFRHAILAGTVGAVCFPLMIGIWTRCRKLAIVGLITCLVMVVACASSGPIMSLVFAIFALWVWRYRHLTGVFRKAAVCAYIALELKMERPAYYLISRIDLAGGSTGWHRSHLIDSTIKYFSEWWLFGTDYTRHWMPSGITWSAQHTDITNYYIGFAVIGGLVAMLLVILVLWRAFCWIGDILVFRPDLPMDEQFGIWCLGAGLFSHAVTSISVAYYDQSYVFFWFNVAIISSLYSVLCNNQSSADRSAEWSVAAAQASELKQCEAGRK